MQEVTLGGDRLGSGKKMKVGLHNYERSTHNLGYLWRSTMAAGTLVPFMSKVALPGDTFDINLDCDVKTHPTIGPLFGSYKIQLDVFQAPIRLYNSLLNINALNIGMDMSQVKFPLIELQAKATPSTVTDIDNSQVNPSSLLSYLGIRGVGITTADTTRRFNAIPILAYWDIYKNYYANKQEEIGAVLHTPADPLGTTPTTVDILDEMGNSVNILPQEPTFLEIGLYEGYSIKLSYIGTAPDPDNIMVQSYVHGWQPLSFFITQPGTDTGTAITWFYNFGTLGAGAFYNWRMKTAGDLNPSAPGISLFPLENLDTAKEEIQKAFSKTAPFVINTMDLAPYKYLYEWNNSIPNILSSQEGLGLKTYNSDLFNNWLQTEWIDGTNGITQITAVDTSDGSFTLDTLNLSQKVYNMLNRIAVSGGSYNEWQNAVYDHKAYVQCTSPMYQGGLIKELVFQEVVSNSQSENQPLGTLAGKGVMSKKHKGGSITIKVDEPSYIIGIISLTPRLDYSQGNEWDMNLETMDDLHKPALDEIGFQELITEQMAWWSTEWDAANSVWIQKSAGKQPAWINYMTSVNQCRGNFAISTNEMFMTLNRRYEHDEATNDIQDLTTYIDPSKYNFIFAQTSIDAQNFWTQIAVDITARRKMSAKIMPNL